MTDTALARGLAAGRLHPVFPGVFAVGHPGVGERGRIFAAALACGPGTIVSHDTAANLLGLWGRAPANVHVIAPRQGGRKISGIRRHYVPFPTPQEVIDVDGIPCTSAPRTLVDSAGSRRVWELKRMVENAAVLRVLDIAAIDLALSSHRRRGAPRLRSLVEVWRVVPAGTRLRSPLEAKLLPLIIERGLPMPRCNHKMWLGGRKIEPDFFWPKQSLIVETDGGAFHNLPGAFEGDRGRDLDFQLEGYRVIRLTWRQVTKEPEKALATIARYLT